MSCLTFYICLWTQPYFQSIPGVPVSNIYERENMTFCPILDEGGLQVDMGSGQALISWREITRKSLTMGDELGRGEFGIVKRATWFDDQSNTKVPVAVKTIKSKWWVVVEGKGGLQVCWFQFEGRGEVVHLTTFKALQAVYLEGFRLIQTLKEYKW